MDADHSLARPRDMSLRAYRRRIAGVIALAGATCLSACASDVTWKPSGGNVGCTFWPVTGTLAVIDGRTAIVGAKSIGVLPDPLRVRWPDGWQVRSVPGGLEVLDATGKVAARTGTPVTVSAATGAADSPGSPMIVDGALLACPYNTVVEG
jgi:hypothetical protein